MPRGATKATFVLGDVVGSTRLWSDLNEIPDALDALDERLDQGAAPIVSGGPPPGYHTVTPRMFVDDVAGQVDFLRRASAPPVGSKTIARSRSSSATRV